MWCDVMWWKCTISIAYSLQPSRAFSASIAHSHSPTSFSRCSMDFRIFQVSPTLGLLSTKVNMPHQNAKRSESRAIVLIPCFAVNSKYKRNGEKRLGKSCKINIYRKAVPSKKPSSGCWSAAGTSNCHTAPWQLASRGTDWWRNYSRSSSCNSGSAARAQIARPIVGPASSKRLGLNSFEMLSGCSSPISEALLLFCLTFSLRLSDAQLSLPLPPFGSWQALCMSQPAYACRNDNASE